MRTLFAAYEKLMDVVYSLIRICIAAALVVMVVVTGGYPPLRIRTVFHLV